MKSKPKNSTSGFNDLMIKRITEKLYSDIPRETLYHYTNFSGLMGIVNSKALWASDIRYMNDSAELKHTVDLIKIEVNRRIADGHDNPKLLNEFLDWVAYRVTNVHMLFGASFRSNGNLLSQWRGYSSLGKGVSIGFHSQYILECAQRQSFQVGRCIYDLSEQSALIESIIDVVEILAQNCCKKTEGSSNNVFNSYQDVFEKIESDLLRIAALLKHPSFQEEEEWRIVSPVITDYLTYPILFREGASMLVPYVEFRLLSESANPIVLEHVFLGPTPNKNISMNSLAMFLSKNGIRPAKGITYCQIPYRKR